MSVDYSEADVIAGPKGQHLSSGEYGVDDRQHTIASVALVADRRRRLVSALLPGSRRGRRTRLAGVQRRHRVRVIAACLH